MASAPGPLDPNATVFIPLTVKPTRSSPATPARPVASGPVGGPSAPPAWVSAPLARPVPAPVPAPVPVQAPVPVPVPVPGPAGPNLFGLALALLLAVGLLVGAVGALVWVSRLEPPVEAPAVAMASVAHPVEDTGLGALPLAPVEPPAPPRPPRPPRPPGPVVQQEAPGPAPTAGPLVVHLDSPEAASSLVVTCPSGFSDKALVEGLVARFPTVPLEDCRLSFRGRAPAAYGPVRGSSQLSCTVKGTTALCA